MLLRVYGYLWLFFISMHVSYVLNILPVIFSLYLLVTTIQLEYDWWNYYHYMIICCNTQICKVARGTIRKCTINKNYYYINVVCIQIVPHCGTNQGCSINQGNMAYCYLSIHLPIKIVNNHNNGTTTATDSTYNTLIFGIIAMYYHAIIIQSS